MSLSDDEIKAIWKNCITGTLSFSRAVIAADRAKGGNTVPDEGKLWSFLRKVLSQGAAIHQDNPDRYEIYSARLDAAAAERADELLAMLAAALKPKP
jgi:hypothetical protein